MASAAFVIIGSEMVDPDRRDANGPYARLKLLELGIKVNFIARVEDDEKAIADALRAALEGSDVVITSGGLGPTGDDVTREAVASLFKAGVREDEGWMDILEKRLAERGRPITKLGRRQAMVVEGGEALANNAGLACGNWLERDGKVLVLLPGVPREFQDILDNEVLHRLAARFPSRPETRVVRATVAGIPEVQAEETLRPWYNKPGVAVSILPSLGVLKITFTITSPPAVEAERLQNEARLALAEGLGINLVSLDGASLPEVLGRTLLEKGATLAVAESCTGGLVAQKVVSAAGASRYFLGSITAYANDAKQKLLGVPEETLQKQGAVSPETALAMARGARARFLASWAVATTGIAGPSGGTLEKPVGTVWIGVTGPGVEKSFKIYFPMDRESMMELSANYALFYLWRAVKGDSL
ncbi:MAG: CinA family nicotinamide mononucleotide deamidase-related protein [Acidobacteria bacterium]|nr:CinA family nicotinamide mononucleotide deamidase-related protein [Acidobacteriota bacterium]